MRRISLALFFGSAAVIGVACEPPADDDTSCGRAKSVLAECGVLLPFELGETCTGMTQAISDCIVAAGASCDALAEVARHVDRCAVHDGGPRIPDDFPGVSASDASSSFRIIEGSP